MPFGLKPDGSGTTIDFDCVYSEVIAPAVDAAGLDPLRADEEQAGGFIHKPMFERLILCEYAVADLTTSNANVFYELGIRHAVRPWSTVAVYAQGGRLPFDVAPIRALPYEIGADGKPADAERGRSAVKARLVEARVDAQDRAKTDSPIYQLVEGYPEVNHEKTDVFRERVRYSQEVKARLARARDRGRRDKQKALDELSSLESELEPFANQEFGVLVDLFLSYRSLSAWSRMIRLADRMPSPLARSTLVQEQYALALNRDERGDEAERILRTLLETKGPSSETFGILGRILKDRWDSARNAGDDLAATGYLDQAIEAYSKGFETDWRDPYPGVNAVTLMECRQPPDPAREHLIPVVAYAVNRRIESGKPDYWDYATLVELEILAKHEAGARRAYSRAVGLIRETWEPETTARNLHLIREARQQRRETVGWADSIEDDLRRRANP